MWLGRSLGDWSMLATLVVVWGSAFLLIELSVATIPPFTAVVIRLVFGLAVLYPAMRWLGQRMPPLSAGGFWRGPWPMLFGVGLAANALPFALVMWGQTEVESSLAGIYMAVSPLTTLVLAHYFFPEERLTAGKVAGFVLGFIGIVLLMGPTAFLGIGAADTFWHQFAVLGAALSYGVGNIIARFLRTVPAIAAGTALTLCALMIMIPVALIVDRPWDIQPDMTSLVAAFVLGLLPTGLANIVFFRLINSAGSTFVALSAYLIPVWAVVMGVVFLGERPGWNALAALMVILIGVAVSQVSPKARPPAPSHG